MEFPAGEIVEEGIKLNDVDVSQILKELCDQRFSGYVIATVYGHAGIEEGLLLFKEGIAIGSVFEFSQMNKTIEGDNAMLYSLNALKAKYGVMDINSLSKQQAELIITFKDSIKAKERAFSELKKMIPAQYSSEYSKRIIREASEKEKTRYEVMKALGLVELE